MVNKIAKEAIGAAQRILDPMFNEYDGGRRRFAKVRKVLIREMIANGPLTLDEVENAKQKRPMKSEQEARDWAMRLRAGPWFPPGEPDRG